MKKRGIIIFAFLFLLLIPLIISDETSQVEKAYDFVENTTSEIGCSNLALEEKIFVYFSNGLCKSELLNSVLDGECFSEDSSSCDLELTSLAAIVFGINNKDISNYTSWISEQKMSTDSLEWFLQIDSSGDAFCTITSSDEIYSLELNSNEKLTSSDSSSCFSIYNNYWIEISPSCYDNFFNVSCDSLFSTNLFFRKSSSSEMNFFYTEKSASSDGIIKNEINSFCFSSGSSCDYSETLWATIALDVAGNETVPFLPYLVAFSELYSDYLPDSFIYYLTSKNYFLENLISLQNSNGFWNASGNKYYDTALALLFYSENSTEKQNAQSWLLANQANDGSWNENSSSNLIDTSFILASLWEEYGTSSRYCGNGFLDLGEICDGTKLRGNDCASVLNDKNATGTLLCYPEGNENECTFNISACVGGTECTSDENCSGSLVCSNGVCVNETMSDYECDDDNPCPDGEECINNICVEETIDCEPDHGFCMSKSACISNLDGNILSNYDCEGTLSFCCDRDSYSCSGEICSSDEVCTGTMENENCCLDGECVNEGDLENECEENSGTCKTSCSSNEKESSYSCDSSSQVCCIEKESSNWLIIILIILILVILVFVLIKFKDKIFPKKPSKKQNFNRGNFPKRPLMRINSLPVRKPLPKPAPKKFPVSAKKKLPKKTKNSVELDEVLKKLREMAK